MQSQSKPHKPHKQPPPQPKAKARKPKSSGAQLTAPTSAGKRWSVGATWDGFGVKAGLDINSRSVMNPNTNSKTSGPIYKHSEVVATLTSPAATQKSIMETHVFQPASRINFPWLSNMATGFQQYRVRHAAYRYEPFTSVFGDTGKQGRVSLFFDYNVSSPIDSSIDDMLNKAPSVNVQSSSGVSLRLNPAYMIDNTRKTKNLRGDDQTSSNLDQFDAGHLIVGLDEFTTSAEFGKIWVDYEVEFLIPSSQRVIGFAQSATIDAFRANFVYSAASGTIMPVNAGWTANAHNAGNVHLKGSTGSMHFEMEQGTFMVQMAVASSRAGVNTISGIRTYHDILGIGTVGDTANFLALPAVYNVTDLSSTVFLSIASGSTWHLTPQLQCFFSGLPNNSFDVVVVFVYSE